MTLEEAKDYLRVTSSDDDELIQTLIKSSEELVRDVGRLDTLEGGPTTVIFTATAYALAYLYEHREDADYTALTMNLRSILFSVRETRF